MRHSEIADLCKKGYKPRVVQGKVTTSIPVDKNVTLVKTKSLTEKIKINEDKIVEVNAKVPKK